MNLARPGVYAVRSEQADSFAATTVEHWLNSEGESPLKSCLWLTAQATPSVRRFLEPHLLSGHASLKGLDVVSVAALHDNGGAQGGVRELCRALNSLIVLKPAQVIIEHAELWFDHGNEPLHTRNARAQMELLHRWARHANARVILPIEGSFSQWCMFADGLAHADLDGQLLYSPWWPAAWGFKSSLWHGSENLPEVPQHVVLSAHLFDNLRDLGKAIHGLRYGSAEDLAIHVQTREELDEHVCSVLLRLGADTVVFDDGSVSSWLNIPAKKIVTQCPDEQQGQAELPHFARDMHELFMPGQLTLLNNMEFAIQGLMMQDVCARWGLQCSLTRLSLLGHMSAQTALRLANFGEASCMFTATREAVYLFKVWSQPPAEHMLSDWLDVCFHEKLMAIFSGDIHILEHLDIQNLLIDLHSELEPPVMTDLESGSLNEPSFLADVWQNNPEDNRQRPWLKRLGALTKTTPGVES